MNLAETILLLNVLSTFYLIGLIWTMQRVHYPAFRYVPGSVFRDFEAFHQRRIAPVVMPAMVIEAATAALLLALRPGYLSIPAVLVGIGLTAVVWVSTFTLQAPMHKKLAAAFADKTLHRLIQTNWLRTAAWSARGGWAAWALILAVDAEAVPV